MAQATGTPPEPTATQNPSQPASTATQGPGSGAAPAQNTTPSNAPPAQTTAPNTDFTPAVSGPPQTRILDSSVVGKHTGVTGAPDPLLDTPPAPKGAPTLVGGTAVKVDRVRNRLVLEPFGTRKRIPIYVDERSHLYRDGVETTIERVRKGDRVYADTVLDGAHVFAKNVRVLETGGSAEVRGQITSYDPQRKVVTLLDGLSQRSVTFAVNDQTRIQQGKGTGALAEGALIDVQFSPGQANRGLAREITVLAAPGATYVFSGLLTNVNMRDGVLSIDNRSDGKTYDVAFTPAGIDRSLLRVGANVTVAATFDGAVYRASRVTPVPVSAANAEDDAK